MNIEKDSQKLNIYMFTIQRGPIQINLAEDFKAIMAYNDVDALNMIRKDYLAGAQIFIKKRAQVEVKKIIDVIGMPQELKVHVVSPPIKKKTNRDFVNGMMLIADKFVKNKSDQASLKRIVNKIKIREDRSTIKSKENLA